MKKKLILLLVALLAVGALTAAVIFLNKTDTAESEEEETTTATVNESRLLYDKDPKKIQSIEITNSTGSFAVKKYAEDAWLVEGFESIIHDTSLISGLLDSCATLTASQTAAEKAEDLSVYGLDAPRATVVTTFEDGSVRTLEVGKETPKATLTYARSDGGDAVIVVDTSSVEQYLESKFYFLQKTVYTLRQPKDENDKTDYSKIDKITIERKDLDYPVVLEYDVRQDDDTVVSGNSSTHVLTSPVRLDLDPDPAYNIINGIFGLTADEVAIVAPSEESLEQYGLLDPACRVTWEIAGESVTVSFGNEYKDSEGVMQGYFGTADGFDEIFVFGKNNVPWMDFKLEKISMPLITTNYIYTVNSFDIKVPDKEYSFSLSGGQDEFAVRCETTGEDMDADLFKGFYQYFLKAPAEEIYLTPDEAQPLVTVTVKTDTLTDTVEFIDTGDRMCDIRLNGKTSFRCRKTYVSRLIENLDRLFAGEEPLTTW